MNSVESRHKLLLFSSFVLNTSMATGSLGATNNDFGNVISGKGGDDDNHNSEGKALRPASSTRCKVVKNCSMVRLRLASTSWIE
jgi:hypothetical protein